MLIPTDVELFLMQLYEKNVRENLKHPAMGISPLMKGSILDTEKEKQNDETNDNTGGDNHSSNS